VYPAYRMVRVECIGSIEHMEWTRATTPTGGHEKPCVLTHILRNIQVLPTFFGGVTGSFAVLLHNVPPACERRSDSRGETRNNL
jgi:hypothetical protein